MTDKRNEDRLLKMAAQIKEQYPVAEIAQLIRLIQPTPGTGEMTVEEFEHLMQILQANNSRRGYSEKSIEAARLVLVMGASIAEAAADTEQSRQSVNQLMIRIRRRMENLPTGWVKVEDWFPAGIGKQLLALAKDLQGRQERGENLDSLTVAIASTGKT